MAPPPTSAGHLTTTFIMRKVLIVTGSLALPDDESAAGLLSSLKNQWRLLRASEAPWLEAAIKLDLVEQLFLFRRALRARPLRNASYAEAVRRFFGSPSSLDVPELGEVSLASSLSREELSFEATTIAKLTRDESHREGLLAECDCVFLSSTYLRDETEVELVAALLKRPDNKVVVGGALTALLGRHWRGSKSVDVVAVGYGELLVPALAAWIRSGYATLEAPPTGRVLQSGQSLFIYSGYPPGRSLDALAAPDWSVAQRYHGRQFGLALYESVRGCPYRCAFCNYPFLQGDLAFRTRSAERIARDWHALAELGIEHVNCLDSLFTVPRKRLVRLCELLVARQSPIRWTCFARADDLGAPEVCDLMKQAGCQMVLIGIESGNQTILNNMNKQTSVEANGRALDNCRQAGITTSVSLIVGFPGETHATVEDTLGFLRAFRPDMFHVYVFTVRSEQMPVLGSGAAGQFGLRIHDTSSSGQPYWSHDTMSCVDAVAGAHTLKGRLMQDGVSLEGAAFYPHALGMDRRDLADLLQFQKDVVAAPGALRLGFAGLRHLLRTRLARDVREKLAA